MVFNFIQVFVNIWTAWWNTFSEKIGWWSCCIIWKAIELVNCL